MQQTPPKVMIVDDSPSDIHVLLHHIGKAYQVTAATSADQALEQLRAGAHPDVILLDVNMPGTNGYDACVQIKQDSTLRDIEILFVSANDSTEEIIRGIDAGAIDYVVKPFDPSVIESKLRRVIEHSKNKRSLISRADEAQKLVYSVLNEAGQMGVVLNFLRESFKVRDTASLLQQALEALSAAGVDGVVFFKKNDLEELGSNGVPPGFLELNLIERVFQSHAPLLERDHRCIITRDHVVIYIKNFPEDPSKAGTLKDSLMILIEAINERLNGLWDRKAYASQREDINNVIAHAKLALAQVQTKQTLHKKNSANILDKMVADIESRYYTMGLTDAQEQILSAVMQNTIAHSLDLLDQGAQLDSELASVIAALAEITKEKP